MSQNRISGVLSDILDLEIPIKLDEKDLPKGSVISKEDVTLARFEEEDFKTPIYNIWAWTKCSNEVEHFGKPFRVSLTLKPPAFQR